MAVGAPNVGATGTDVRDGHANPTGRLGDGSTLLQCVVDAFDAVPLHLQEEAGGHLRLRCSGVEEGRGRVCEELPGHQVVPRCRKVTESARTKEPKKICANYAFFGLAASLGQHGGPPCGCRRLRA